MLFLDAQIHPNIGMGREAVNSEGKDSRYQQSYRSWFENKNSNIIATITTPTHCAYNMCNLI